MKTVLFILAKSRLNMYGPYETALLFHRMLGTKTKVTLKAVV